MCDSSTTNRAIDSSDGHADIDLPSRRSDVLRSVSTSHPRNSRLDRMTLQSARRRVTRAEQRRRATFSIRRERPYMSFHKDFHHSLVAAHPVPLQPKRTRERIGVPLISMHD